MAKKNAKVLAAVRDDLIVNVTSVLATDTDADRAWRLIRLSPLISAIGSAFWNTLRA